MKITLTGSNELGEAFRSLVPEIRSKSIAKLAQSVYKDVLTGADKHTKTGLLHQSIQLRKVDEDTYVIYHDSQIASYWSYIHWGAKPHLIRIKRKKALRWPYGNGFVFAKFVHHPGYKGDAYMVRALDAAPDHFRSIINSLQARP